MRFHCLEEALHLLESQTESPGLKRCILAKKQGSAYTVYRLGEGFSLSFIGPRLTCTVQPRT